MKLSLATILMGASLLSIASGVQGQINPGTPWPATDALGRQLPTAEEVGPPRPGRQVAIFYFLTHVDQRKNTRGAAPFDVSRILAQDPKALEKPDSPLWGPLGAAHYWGEPLFGYYRSTDPWVLRRHARLLADAGIDTLIFDTTNTLTYPDVYLKICEVFRQVRHEGGRTPQIAFMVNTQANATALRLYHDLYQPGLYRELWFLWQGKPLLICDPQQASPELREFFTLRRAHWPFTMIDTPLAWHWEATYPQPYGYADDPTKPEQVNVSVAQNLRQSDGRVTNMSFGDARGRSFHDGHADRSPGAVNQGYNFQEQWKRALALDPPMVMVTGWNEWTASRFGQPHGPVTFVDQFDEEFSRDIEPMQGGHGDNYYWQLVAGVRRYKGSPPIPKASAPTTIRLEGGFDSWRDVGPEFTACPGDSVPRDCDGIAGLHYANQTGRNELSTAKVARDDRNVYFYLQTREPIVPTGRMEGLWLFLKTDRSATASWEGCNFVVGRLAEPDGVWLEENTGGWNWKKVAKVSYRVVGRELQMVVPRAALRLAKPGSALSFDFKWADNLQRPGDVMDFYRSGDTAPAGRFFYRYLAE
jgi:hypothetical protein